MTSNDQNRLFVAVDMPEVVQKEIERIKRVFQKQELFEGRFTKPDQVHITLKFIGKIATNQIEKIDTVLKTIYAHKITAQVGSVDVFTVGNRIKILYLNLLCPELAMLAEKVKSVLLPWCEKEHRSFVSHATIARIKRVENKQRLLDFVRNFSVTPIDEFVIDSFVLKQSVLLPQGPEYTTLETYQLQDT